MKSRLLTLTPPRFRRTIMSLALFLLVNLTFDWMTVSQWVHDDCLVRAYRKILHWASQDHTRRPCICPWSVKTNFLDSRFEARRSLIYSWQLLKHAWFGTIRAYVYKAGRHFALKLVQHTYVGLVWFGLMGRYLGFAFGSWLEKFGGRRLLQILIIGLITFLRVSGHVFYRV
jgi:hypothetical protein